MKVIIISGFLGSGKTSLISAVTNSFVTAGIKIAVIENEISPSGLDGKFLEKQGLRVRELVSGCICCQLQGELSGALEEIAKEYKPDVVFIEPTGAAAPGHVKDAIQNNSCVDEIIMVTILDARRLAGEGLKQYPFIEQSIRKADLVVINKIDMVALSIVESILSSTVELNSSVDIIPLSLESRENLTQLTEKLKVVEKCTSQSKALCIESLVDHHPVSISFRRSLKANTNSVGIEELIDGMLNKLATELLENGCNRIGHIKITAEKGADFLFFSKTSFSGTNDKKGVWSYNNTGDCQINGNVIVYGLSKPQVENISKNVLSKTLLCLAFA